MRLGEVIRLDRPDLDTDEAIVTIRDSKFGKSRQVPLHPARWTRWPSTRACASGGVLSRARPAC